MKQSTGIKAAVALVAVLVIGVVGAFKFLEKIDNGYVGVRYSMNGGIKDEALTQGVNLSALIKSFSIQSVCRRSKRKTFRFRPATAKKQRSISSMTIKLIQLKQQKCIKSSGTLLART